jgi:hypothetical protein
VIKVKTCVDTYHKELFEEMKTLGRSRSPSRRSRPAKRDRGEYGKIPMKAVKITEKDNGKRKVEDLSAEFTRINIGNNEIYNIMMKEATEAATMV